MLSTLEGNNANDLRFYVSGNQVAVGGSGDGTDRVFISIVIPNGETYKAIQTNGVVLEHWPELR